MSYAPALFLGAMAVLAIAVPTETVGTTVTPIPVLSPSPTVAYKPASPDAEVAPSPGCVTHGEYDQLETLMRPSTVANLFDTNGYPVGTPDPDVFGRGYQTCWAPAQREVVVKYNDQSGHSVAWLIRDT